MNVRWEGWRVGWRFEESHPSWRSNRRRSRIFQWVDEVAGTELQASSNPDGEREHMAFPFLNTRRASQNTAAFVMSVFEKNNLAD